MPVLELQLHPMLPLPSSMASLSMQQSSTQGGVAGPPRVQEGVEAGGVLHVAAKEEGALCKAKAMCTLGPA